MAILFYCADFLFDGIFFLCAYTCYRSLTTCQRVSILTSVFPRHDSHLSLEKVSLWYDVWLSRGPSTPSPVRGEGKEFLVSLHVQVASLPWNLQIKFHTMVPLQAYGGGAVGEFLAATDL